MQLASKPAASSRGAYLGGYDPAMRDDALMKMDRADQLREKYQRCADRRDRAG